MVRMSARKTCSVRRNNGFAGLANANSIDYMSRSMTGVAAEALRELNQRVDTALTRFLSEQGTVWAEQAPEILDALVSFILSGGKRIRSAFCYWGWRGAGGADCEPIVEAAAALELLHAFALIHDDVMDRAETRRGHASMHRQFEALHAGAGWRGDSQHFGVSVAVLCGDQCAAWSEQMFAGCGLPQEPVMRAHKLYSRMRTELVAGQYLDLRAAASTGDVATLLNADIARQNIHFKTTLYTVVRPLQLGALLATSPMGLPDAYAEFAEPLGEAFQLRDDLLGLFGDPALTGKSSLEDLREGTRTVLITFAEDMADAAQRATLRQLVGCPTLDETQAASVRQIVEASGALARVEKLISDRYAEARVRLDRLPIADAARQPLAALARTVAFRDR
jgi:geranylgeranyl diphosphate synthase, type I